MIAQRPTFSTTEEWLQHYYDCTTQGMRPWPPATRDELLLADACGLLAAHPEWLPGQQGLAMLGLPSHFGRRLQAWDDRTTEELIVTLIENRESLRQLLGATR